jgi:hypothetical protein
MEKYLDKKEGTKLEAYEVNLYLKVLIERKEFEKAWTFLE